MPNSISVFGCFGLLGALLIGCGDSEEQLEKRPRPVSVERLTQASSPQGALVTASVGAWKTEEIGFEVDGRVEWVAEPNTEIEGRVMEDYVVDPNEPDDARVLTLDEEIQLLDQEREVLIEGTPIARVESERYRLQYERADANVTRAEQALLATETDMLEGIPAQIEAAEASLELASIQFDRSQRLLDQSAGSQSDVDRDKANYESAMAELKRLRASLRAVQADFASKRVELLQAHQDLRDAKRNLEDCTLYSSFPGQIADISVVPGSVVGAGQAVATVQMMNPIKIELEVSAEDSRNLRQNDQLPVTVVLPNGESAVRKGYLYLIDSVADPQTRTFTVTLLVLNEVFTESYSEQIVASTDQLWRLDMDFIPGASDGTLFVNETAIYQDVDGRFFVYAAENVTVDSGPPEDSIIEVRRVQVQLGPLRVPFLGNWEFQQVLIDESQQFDPAVNIVVGKIEVNEGQQWDEHLVLLDSGPRWMLRPGDLAQVNLAGDEHTEGFFVPMNAIVREGDQSFLFVAEESSSGTVAKRIAVDVIEGGQRAVTSGMRQVVGAGGTTLEGLRYITSGAHYLVDGEPIRIVE